MIKRHLPKPASTGRPRADDRTTINGILYVLTTGCRWAELPKRYGDDSTTHRRLMYWQETGVWNRVVNAIQRQAFKSGKLNVISVSVDSTDIPAKKAAATWDMMATRRF